MLRPVNGSQGIIELNEFWFLPSAWRRQVRLGYDIAFASANYPKGGFLSPEYAKHYSLFKVLDFIYVDMLQLEFLIFL